MVRIGGRELIAGITFVISAGLVQQQIFPLNLLTHTIVATKYGVLILSLACQIPLWSNGLVYFRPTSNVSSATTGLDLVPAFIGNTANESACQVMD